MESTALPSPQSVESDTESRHFPLITAGAAIPFIIIQLIREVGNPLELAQLLGQGLQVWWPVCDKTVESAGGAPHWSLPQKEA